MFSSSISGGIAEIGSRIESGADKAGGAVGCGDDLGNADPGDSTRTEPLAERAGGAVPAAGGGARGAGLSEALAGWLWSGTRFARSDGVGAGERRSQ